MYDVREWWLEKAKALYVGEMVRLVHPSDKGIRPSVIIHNDPDKYRAYCHRRNQGDVVFKQHVIPRTAPEGSESDSIPSDIQTILTTNREVQTAIESYLIRKGVPTILIPSGVLHYSESRKRLIFLMGDKALGRDLTDTSFSKWVDYTPDKTGVTSQGKSNKLVLVEDTLSMFKVARAVPDYKAVALLGTKLTDAVRLLTMDAEQVIVMLDGDQAGRRGSNKILRELKSLGVKHYAPIEVPEGKDPKDLTIKKIRELFYGLSASEVLHETQQLHPTQT